MLINELYENTLKYSNSVDKKLRKQIGQFFTSPFVARYMASLMDYDKPVIRILDPGAGTGMLSGALCQEIISNDSIQTVYIDLFETDDNIIPFLQKNMDLIQEEMGKKGKELTYNIIKDNFILYHESIWKDIIANENYLYDIIISNPPYKKIGKSEKEAVVMNSVVHGQPNIYFLFMALSAKLLKRQGSMIFIVPRSFTSGAYFRKFREYFLNTVQLTNLHLFNSRADVFDSDKVLQEAIILKAVKSTQISDAILISSSENMFTDGSFVHEVPYGSVVDMKSHDLFIMIPTSEDEKTWRWRYQKVLPLTPPIVTPLTTTTGMHALAHFCHELPYEIAGVCVLLCLVFSFSCVSFFSVVKFSAVFRCCHRVEQKPNH